jgi:hypothetical protein
MRKRRQQVRDLAIKSWLRGDRCWTLRKMTDLATVVQDRDSSVVLDRVYDGKSGNNDLPMGVCTKFAV